MAEKATRLPQLEPVAGAAAADADKAAIAKLAASAEALNKKKAAAEAKKTNVPDEVYKRNWDAVSDAIAVMNAAAKELKRAKAVVQACYSTANNDGCNIEAMKRLRELEKIDTDELDLDMKTVARIAGIVGSTIAETSIMKLIDEADEVNYFTQGFTAGKAGDARDTCPHQPGSEKAEKWGRGWDEGQRRLQEELLRKPPKEAKPKATGRGAKLN